MLALLAACSSPRPIQSPQLEHATGRATEVAAGPLILRATVLDEQQSDELLQVDAAERRLVPVLFVLANRGDAVLTVGQDDFRLRTDTGRGIAPALPGRAASLLRNEGGSTAAIWTGYATIGFLAAPAIDAAEKREEQAARASRGVLFSSDEVAPGESVVGYLIFESPLPVEELSELALAFITPNTADAVRLPLINPYRPSH